MGTSFADRLAQGRSGDRCVLDELFGPWRALLRLQARQLLGAELAGRIDPSDVVQEAYQQACTHLEHFRGHSEGEWVNWLRAIVAATAANVCRRHRTQKRSIDSEAGRSASDKADSAPGPLTTILLREQEARLAAAIEALPTEMREVVLRRVFHREPFDVVAKALNRSPGATRVVWTRALRRLRDLLASDSQVP